MRQVSERGGRWASARAHLGVGGGEEAAIGQEEQRQCELQPKPRHWWLRSEAGVGEQVTPAIATAATAAAAATAATAAAAAAASVAAVAAAASVATVADADAPAEASAPPRR